MRAIPPPPTGRFTALSAQERLVLALGAVAVLAFGLWLTSGESDAPAVELVAPPPSASILPTPPIPPAVTLPAPTYFAPTPAMAPPPASASGIRLAGVMGRGAILIMPDGHQRAVPIGREFLPGHTLKEVGVAHALVGGPGGDIRLELNRFEAAAPPTPSAAPAM